MKGVSCISLLMLVTLALAASSCQGRVEPTSARPNIEGAQETALQGKPVEFLEPSLNEPEKASAQLITGPAATAVEEKSTAEQERNKQIQQALKNAGFYFGNIDGIVGAQTQKAIEQFQQSNGLQADGKVGPKTREILQKYLTQEMQSE